MSHGRALAQGNSIPPPGGGGGSGGCQGGNCRLIGDRAWDDLDLDGIQDYGDPYQPEPPLAGVTVNLYQTDATGAPMSGSPWQTAVTGPDGRYQFDVVDGYYRLQFLPPPVADESQGVYELTQPDQGSDYIDSDADPATGFTDVFLILPGLNQRYRWDAGFFREDPGGPGGCPDKWTLGDQLWRDLDGDGLYTEKVPGTPGGDDPLPSIKVDLFQRLPIGGGFDAPVMRNGRPLSTFSDARGRYRFTCLDDGTYAIVMPDVGEVGAMNSTFVVDPNVPEAPFPGGTDHDSNVTSDFSDPNVPNIAGAAAASAFITLNSAEGSPTEQATLDGAFACDESPAYIFFVMDVSGSMGERHGPPGPAGQQPRKIDSAIRAATSFVDRLVSPRKAGVVWFNDEAGAFTFSPGGVTLTDQYDQVRSAIAGLSPTDGTQIQEGLALAIDELDALPVEDTTPKFIILLSDGKNQPASGDEATEAQGIRARSKGIRVVSIAFGDDANETLLTNVAFDPSYFRKAPTEADLWLVYQQLLPTLCSPLDSGLSCSEPGAVNINLNTGVDVDGSPPRDQKWSIPTVSTSSGGSTTAPGKAYVIEEPPEHWGWVPLPNTQWISHAADALVPDLPPPPTTYAYERTFKLPDPIPSSIEMRLHLWSDDLIDSVELNGVVLPHSGSGAFGSAPPSLVIERDPSHFQVGDNVLRVTVRDAHAVAAGLVAQGYVSACENPDPVGGRMQPCSGPCPGDKLGYLWTYNPPIPWSLQFGASVPSGEHAMWTEAIQKGGINAWNDVLDPDPWTASPVAPASAHLHMKVLPEADMSGPMAKWWRETKKRKTMGWWKDMETCDQTPALCDSPPYVRMSSYPVKKARIVFAYDFAFQSGRNGVWQGYACAEGSHNITTLAAHELGHAIGLGHNNHHGVMDNGENDHCNPIHPNEIATAECLIEQWRHIWLGCLGRSPGRFPNVP